VSRRWGDRLIFALLLVVLLGVSVISFLGDTARQGQAELRGSTLSAAPPGTLALYRWLEDAGYPVTRIQGSARFADALRDTDLLFVLNPQTQFSPEQLAALEAWMGAGGVLVLSIEGSEGLLNPITARLGAELSPILPPIAGALPLRQPLWTDPPVRTVSVQTSWQLDLKGDDAIPLLSAGSGPLMVAQPRGRGRLILLSTTWPVTNAGLREADNRWLAWNLAASGAGRRIAFDEIHHGYTGGDLRALVLSRPWGWALIYAAGVLVVGLLLAGRRLGPPLVLASQGGRRGAAEYVAALAGLFQRAGRTDWVAGRYRAEFRRALAAPYGLDATASAGRLAAAFAAAHHRPVDVPALTALLTDLDAAATPAGPGGKATGDAALLRLVRRAEAFRNDII
jgi:hypothetical protein